MNKKVKSPGNSHLSSVASPDPMLQKALPGLFKKQQCGYYLSAKTKKRFNEICKNHGIKNSDLAEYAIVLVLDVIDQCKSFDIKKAIEGSK